MVTEILDKNSYDWREGLKNLGSRGGWQRRFKFFRFFVPLFSKRSGEEKSRTS